MKTDPILKEIHQIRETLSRKFDFDIRKIFEDVRRREKEHKERVVNLQVKQEKDINPMAADGLPLKKSQKVNKTP